MTEEKQPKSAAEQVNGLDSKAFSKYVDEYIKDNAAFICRESVCADVAAEPHAQHLKQGEAEGQHFIDSLSEKAASNFSRKCLKAYALAADVIYYIYG